MSAIHYHVPCEACHALRIRLHKDTKGAIDPGGEAYTTEAEANRVAAGENEADYMQGWDHRYTVMPCTDNYCSVRKKERW